MEQLIKALKQSDKPQCLWIDPKIPRTLKDPDALSMSGTVFRNGGTCGDERAVPFCEVTPQLQALLKAIYA